MLTTLTVIGGLIVVGLVWAYPVDRRSRRRGDTPRGAAHLQTSIKNARRDMRAWDKFTRAHPNGPPRG